MSPRNGSGLQFRTDILAKLLRDHLDAAGESLEVVAARSKVSVRTLTGILAGDRAFVGIAVADDLVTHGLGDSSLFHTLPELESVYDPRGFRRRRRRRLLAACAGGSTVRRDLQVRAVMRMLDTAARKANA